VLRKFKNQKEKYNFPKASGSMPVNFHAVRKFFEFVIHCRKDFVDFLDCKQQHV